MIRNSGLISWLFILASLAVVGKEPVLRQVEVNNHRFALWEKRGSNPTDAVLLVHGRTWSALPDFDLHVPGEKLSLMDALAGRGFAVYALDMRGYGGTARDESGWLSPNKAADDVAAILEWINIHSGVRKKASVLGWSMGSTTCQLAIQRHPGLISSLILYGYWYDPRKPISENPDPKEPERKANTAKNAASDFITPGAISQQAIDAYVKASLAADPVRADWRRLHQFNALDASTLQVPVMLIHGRNDPLVNQEAHFQIFSALQHADRSWISLAGGDHAVSLEAPMNRFIEMTAAFMKAAK